MGNQGDFGGTPIQQADSLGNVYVPGSESGNTWSTAYSSEYVGMYAGVGPEFYSNFNLRDIGGKTAGICVTPWDFNFLQVDYRVRFGEDPVVVSRPTDYTRKGFTGCDCSYRICDSAVNSGLGYTFDYSEFEAIMIPIFRLAGISFSGDVVTTVLGELGYNPQSPTEDKTGEIPLEEVSRIYLEMQKLENVVLGSGESVLANYAFADILGSVTAGVAFKNNLMSLLTFSSGALVVEDTDWGDGGEGSDWTSIPQELIEAYSSNSSIPGLTVKFKTAVTPNIDKLEFCMCLDAGMYGLDAHPDVDRNIIDNQRPVENEQDLKELGFEGDPSNYQELKNFFTLDPEYLKSRGVTGVKPYKYGPNWAYGGGFLSLNVLATAVPEYKNWEARNSGKIRMSGTPNGEPYAFGNQWLDWSGRIGTPEIQYVPVNSITLGGGDFVDMNFGYRGNLEGSLIYRGRLPSDLLAYENSDYKFAFLGITSGTLPLSSGGFNNFLLGLTSIRHDDAVTNEEAYGVSGDLEDLIFSAAFSESPQDKTIHTT